MIKEGMSPPTPSNIVKKTQQKVVVTKKGIRRPDRSDKVPSMGAVAKTNNIEVTVANP